MKNNPKKKIVALVGIITIVITLVITIWIINLNNIQSSFKGIFRRNEAEGENLVLAPKFNKKVNNLTLGDLDGDRFVTLYDAMITFKAATKSIILTEGQKKVANIVENYSSKDGSAIINTTDANEMQKIAAGTSEYTGYNQVAIGEVLQLTYIKGIADNPESFTDDAQLEGISYVLENYENIPKEEVATIDSDGNLKAIGKGKVKIRVAQNNVVNESSLNVLVIEVVENKQIKASINKKVSYPKVGDINGDGFVTNYDAELALEYYNENIKLTNEQKDRADINKDGIINSGDSSEIKTIANGTYISEKSNIMYNCVNVGDTVHITYGITSTNNIINDTNLEEITYSVTKKDGSDATELATINENGELTAKGNGVVKITIKYKGTEVDSFVINISTIENVYTTVDSHTENPTLGDVDRDGFITDYDVLSVVAESTNYKYMTKNERSRADMNKDGSITLSDSSIMTEIARGNSDNKNTLLKGNSIKLGYAVKFASGEVTRNQELEGITYELTKEDGSDATEIASIDDTGTLKAIGNGTIKVIVKYNEKKSDALVFQIIDSKTVYSKVKEQVNHPLSGDIDGDGFVTQYDAELALLFYKGKVNLTDEQQKRADVNNTNEVDTDDSAQILSIAIGKKTGYNQLMVGSRLKIDYMLENENEELLDRIRLDKVKYTLKKSDGSEFADGENNIATIDENGNLEVIGVGQVQVNVESDGIESKGFVIKGVEPKEIRAKVKGKAENPVLGDVDGDGFITNYDAKLIAFFATEKIELTEEQQKRADYNKDGVVKGNDALEVEKIANGLTTGYNKVLKGKKIEITCGVNGDEEVNAITDEIELKDINYTIEKFDATDETPLDEIATIDNKGVLTTKGVGRIKINVTYKETTSYGFVIEIVEPEAVYAKVNGQVENPKLGDVNGDGFITNYDAILIKEYSLARIELSEEQLKRADYNRDGVVDSRDAVAIVDIFVNKDKQKCSEIQVQNKSQIGYVIEKDGELTDEEVEGISYSVTTDLDGVDATNFASIDDNGVLTAKSAGYVIVTITCNKYTDEDGDPLTDSFMIHIIEPSEIYAKVKGQVENPKIGDVNGDGFITKYDYTIVLKYKADDPTLTLTDDELKRADINDDGKVTSGDATIMMHIVSGDKSGYNKIEKGREISIGHIAEFGDDLVENKELDGMTYRVEKFDTADEKNIDEIATITDEGILTTKGSGKVKVTITYKNLTDSFVIEIVEPKIEGISKDRENSTWIKPGKLKLKDIIEGNKYWYTLNNGKTWIVYEEDKEIELANDGKYIIKIKSGNTEETAIELEETYYVNVDGTKPTVEIVAKDKSNEEINTNPVENPNSIIIKISDGTGSGLNSDKIRYMISKTEPTSETSTWTEGSLINGEMNVEVPNEEGDYKIYIARLSDRLGNTNTENEYISSEKIYRIKKIKIVGKIEIKSTPTKTTYIKGEELDLTGGKITVTYEDSTSNEADITADMVTGYNSNTLGEQTITVTYEGKTTTFKVTVKNDLKEIKVKDLPTKTVYIKGEELDLTGGKITEIYEDNTNIEVDITEDMITGYDRDILGEQTIIVTHKGKKVTFKVVVKNEVTGITIKDEPTKTTYIKGEELDLTGGKITVTYEDNTTADIPITKDMISKYDKNNLGEQTILVTYKGKTTTFKVVVKNEVTGIKIKDIPTKTTYIKGEELDLTGGKITVTYEDKTTTDILITTDMITGYNKQEPGDQTITITYGGKTATFKVKVKNDIVDIIISNLPTKLIYEKGNDIDLSGGKIKVVYENGETIEEEMNISDISITGYDANKLGEQVITVKYKGKTVTFKVSVKTASNQKENSSSKDQRPATKKDNTTANIILPKTGMGKMILGIIIVMLTFGTITYIGFRKLKDIK